MKKLLQEVMDIWYVCSVASLVQYLQTCLTVVPLDVVMLWEAKADMNSVGINSNEMRYISNKSIKINTTSQSKTDHVVDPFNLPTANWCSHSSQTGSETISWSGHAAPWPAVHLWKKVHPMRWRWKMLKRKSTKCLNSMRLIVMAQ